jgi:hypothetical protein
MFCYACKRKLKVADSTRLGLGPVCLKRLRAEVVSGQVSDLPFDPVRRDIRFERGESGVRHFNIFQTVRLVEDNPGFLWGMVCDSAQVFALQILDIFCWRLDREDGIGPVELLDGEYVSATASRLASDFCREVVALLPWQGGVLTGREVEAWIAAHRPPPLFRPRDEEREGWYST